MNRNSTLIATLLAAAVLVAPVCADDTKPAPPSGSPPAGGPPVGKDSQQGKEGFGKGERGKGGRMAERRNPEAWRKAMEEATADATPETKEKIKAIRSDFEAKTKAWREANGDKIKALEEKMKAARESGAQPDGSLMKEMQALRATAPKPEEMQSQIFALLTPDQQAKFKERYDALQKEGRGKGKDGAKEGDKDPMAPGGDRPKKRPDGGKPFNFEEGKDAPPANPNGDGKPSGR